jgi:ABC-type amino acid transport substrate-binding protein
MKKAPFILFLLMMVQTTVVVQSNGTRFDIIYPRASTDFDPRNAFSLAVLDLVMNKAGVTYTIQPSKYLMERSRALIELENGNSINLYWTSMSKDHEKKLLPIRIPINRGLIGYRVFVIRKDRQADFDQVQTLDDLKKFTAIQGIGWIDIEIMKHAGLKVETGRYDTIFKMAQMGRIDYIPRGIAEGYAEIKAHADTEPDLTIEKGLLLKYKSDFMFYTNKNNEALAHAIEKGFKIAYQDGSYMELFNSHPFIQDALKQANLANRRVLTLESIHLSAEDHAIPSMYWMP